MGLSPSAPQLPKPPKVFPIDIPSFMQAALQATQFGYDMSDADFISRFPGLVSTRAQDIAQSVKDLTSLDPTTESSFVKNAAGNAFGAFGGGSENPIATSLGSLGRNTVATGVANQTRSFQDAARNNLSSLLSANPERGYVSGADAADVAVQNNAIINQANQNAYLNKIQQANANSAAGAQGTSAAIGIGTSILSAVASSGY